MPNHSLIVANSRKGDRFKNGSVSMNLIKKLPESILQAIKILKTNYLKRSCKDLLFVVSKVANFKGKC